ncbi:MULTISPECIES: bifunctional 2',3'-cyclic-nucleotide 2'-phosphodiesterase/3'-nucleotidase [unclassified Halobacteriovorax]|uniref:bifunctional 2',3'-cyclic-nucleotide 2'-phosphodiesterase/3'-nucleotidase n=1 Tax=unclassified Halobacteriovorax TaxID=2639665 RepID=UPI000EA3167F|nr:bifunctional 2',3'-cyclic-nucleotide 2'-phosphodiesterase/3'-nucleotidase [Halobacteriovorax sp. BALOs_7]AYF45115.1 putative 2',3'-cyclic-nucleotide 2'-phosphodiesterase [Halobacteriovorax sp. BALOs_7]
MKNFFLLSLSLTFLISCQNQTQVKLRIIETTDIHGYYKDYDYYQNRESKKYGLVKTATLIKKYIKSADNYTLVDNGDLIQGSPMADFVASYGKEGTHPAFKLMNHLKYDVGNIGNHEFNYGLDFLNESLKDANFPYINANVFKDENGKPGAPYFKQYIIKEKEVVDTKGKKHKLKIGYIGFVPPQIMFWDKANLEGKVIARDIVEVAKELTVKMKNEGADIIIAIPHSGISTDKYKLYAEDSVFYLSKLPFINAIAFGHTHAVFPSKEYEGIEGIDAKKGTINGKAAVMPGKWGSHIGIIDLKLNYDGTIWSVIDGQSSVESIYDRNSDMSVKPDLELSEIIEEDHQRTLKLADKKIGSSKQDFYSFLSLIQDDATTQIVSNAQMDYVKKAIQGDANLSDLPVLSAVAPFKAGGRKNDPNGYTDVSKGELTIRNAADLYLYPNILYALKITGKDVRMWLECSAGMFAHIDTNYFKEQPLINWGGFRTYNFDNIDGVTYEIDVTERRHFDEDCKVLNKDSFRIKNLKYNGKPVKDNQEFILATNNYRATGGKFSGTVKENVVITAPDTNRQVLINYIRSESKKKGFVEAKPNMNWKIKSVPNAEKLKVYFETSPSKKASRFIKENAIYPLKRLDGLDEEGFARYQINLK